MSPSLPCPAPVDRRLASNYADDSLLLSPGFCLTDEAQFSVISPKRLH